MRDFTIDLIWAKIQAAITVIGGLITSTLLSLLVVPAVFTYIDDLEHLLKRGVAKLRRHKAPLRQDDMVVLEK